MYFYILATKIINWNLKVIYNYIKNMKYVGIKLTKYVEKMKKKCGKCVQHCKLQNTSKKLKLNNYPETNR